MNEKSTLVSNLKKISLSYRIVSTPENAPLRDGTIQFIYGIGHYLTPFEQDLADRSVDEAFTVKLFGVDCDDYFGHIPLSPIKIPEGEISLHFRIDRIEDAQPVEIVKALADMTECCDHCSSC
jgi:FKBP-type peptidyl-prolyl cis-trans isomerase 2